MTSHSTSSPSRPLSHLPMEVKSNIIRFCDPSTLGQVSQVCLAFLELASPLLYEDVALKGPEALELFFCERPSSTHQAHLEPFLSLLQTRSLTFFPVGLFPRDLHLHKDRLLGKLLPLDTLTLRPKAFGTKEAAYGDVEAMSSSFLSLLDPLRVYVIGIRDDPSKPYAYIPELSLEEKTLNWRRIQRLEFTNALASFLGPSSFLVNQESRGPKTPLQVVYNLHQQWEDDCLDGLPFEQFLLYDLSWPESDLASPQESYPIFLCAFVDAVIRVGDEDEGLAVMADVEYGWDLMDLGDETRSGWRRRLRIEVVEETDGEEEEEEEEEDPSEIGEEE